MAARNQNSGETLRNRPGGNRTRRTWSSNGVNHAVETSTFSQPGISMTFQTQTSTIGGGQTGTQRGQGSGLFGTAINLLGGMLAGGGQTGRSRKENKSRQPYVEDMAYGDFLEEDEDRDTTPRVQQQSRALPRQRRPSPVRRESTRSGRSGRSRSYRDDRRQSHASSRARYSDETTDESSEEDDSDESETSVSEDELPPPPKPHRAFTTNDASNLQALENSVEYHRREMESCRKKVSDASRRSRPNTTVLQGLLDELKIHERSYESARENLRIARGGATNNRRQTPQRTSFSTQARSARGGGSAAFQSIHDDPFFADFFRPGQQSTSFSTGNVNQDPFDTFGLGSNGQFAHIDAMFRSFGITPQTQRSSTAVPTFVLGGGRSNVRPRAFTSTGPQFTRTTPGFGAPPPVPQPPPQSQRQPAPQRQPQPPPPPTPPKNLLRPQEAKSLYKTYNERWLALTPSDPSIPYPARGYRPAALCTRDSVWAPTVDSHISTWSEEIVMQANVQAFFLGVVGISPTYTESPATGQIGMGYNRAKASATQTKELVNMLKKEKMRWHSDRLGRRNGGSAGANEALQTDERARAVFHAVCELMNFAQGA